MLCAVLLRMWTSVGGEGIAMEKQRHTHTITMVDPMGGGGARL